MSNFPLFFPAPGLRESAGPLSSSTRPKMSVCQSFFHSGIQKVQIANLQFHRLRSMCFCKSVVFRLFASTYAYTLAETEAERRLKTRSVAARREQRGTAKLQICNSIALGQSQIAKVSFFSPTSIFARILQQRRKQEQKNKKDLNSSVHAYLRTVTEEFRSFPFPVSPINALMVFRAKRGGETL